jgi:hypothetical protein
VQHDEGMQGPSRPSIDLIASPVEAPAFETIVMLRGEHDLATREAVRVALASCAGDVLVCLGACTFVDAGIVGVIAADAIVRRLASHRLVLRVDASVYPIRRVLEILLTRGGLDAAAVELVYVGEERLLVA